MAEVDQVVELLVLHGVVVRVIYCLRCLQSQSIIVFEHASSVRVPIGTRTIVVMHSS